MNRNLKIVSLVFLCIFLIISIGLYFAKDSLLRYYVKGKIERVKKKYNLAISYDMLRMLDIRTIEFTDLTITPNRKDTLLKLGSLKLELAFFELLRMNIDIQQVSSRDIQLRFVKQNGSSNYDFLFKKEESEKPGETESVDYAGRLSKTLNLLFGFLPDNGDIHNLSISMQRDSGLTSIEVPDLKIVDNCFLSKIFVDQNGIKQEWNVEGSLQSSAKKIKAKLSGNKSKINIPYIDKYYGVQIAFDTISFELSEEAGNRTLCLNGKADIAGLEVFYKALSPEVVILDKGAFSYHINIGENYIELDSTTTAQINELQFHPYVRAEKKDKWHVTASINEPWFPADRLFSSLPKGLFDNLKGIKTKGNLAYHLFFDVDFSRLDSLQFESELKGKDFKIIEYGKTDLRRMNSEFIYTAYEQGQAVRSFAVGPSNPNFCPLDSIPPIVQMSVLQSEDGAFFYHKGFLIDAMKEALIHDLKVERFARGGSTITMQLVKNVFLNRNKNLARKLEEALIVWLIENECLSTKHRMLEVYMNIIEWGPLIYGIEEASEFYFNKKPSELNVNEAIFLASIIPSPKRFRSSFDENLNLKERLDGYYHLIGNRLQKKGMISEKEMENIRPEVKIAEEVKKFLVVDSLK